MRILLILCVSSLSSLSITVFGKTQMPATSYPFIETSTFKAKSDYFFSPLKTIKNPELIPGRSIINVTLSLMKKFFTTVHPQLKNYILVTHSLHDISTPGEFARYLDDDNLIVWFGKNPGGVQDIGHPKYIPLPIGISPITRYYDNLELLKKIMHENNNNHRRPILAYVNFTVKNNNPDRAVAFDYFSKQSFATIITERITQEAYLKNLSNSMFVVSPEGKGLDCYRHWEVMLTGAIPIIKHSPLDILFEDLPVLLIDEWDQVTEGFLRDQYALMQKKTYRREKLMADYWLDMIIGYKNS